MSNETMTATPEFQAAWNAWILSVDSSDANDHAFFAAGWEAARLRGESAPYGQAVAHNAGGIDLTACQLHEALMMAGDPEFDVDFEDRGRVRIFYSETGHSGAGVYCECVDAEEEGCIKLDGTSPAIRDRPQPAAVAGGAVRLLPAAWRATIDAASPLNKQDLRPIRFVLDLEAALSAAPAAPESDEQYADAEALIAHLDELMDDGGQGGEKWQPAQAAIAGILSWQTTGSPVAAPAPVAGDADD